MDEPVSPVSLRFDKADLEKSAGGAPTCELCLSDITGAYYEVNGQTACESCRSQAETARTAGSSSGRAFRAFLWGGLGGVAGAGIYYAVLALTGYEIGLVAIVVGLMVGFGVRKGSNGVGGRGYQFLAVAITYFAIVSTYIPFIVEEMMKQGEAVEEEATGAADQATGPAAGASTENVATEPVGEPQGGLLILVVGVVALLVLAAAAPFLAGIENAIGLLIIGFALYEAWRVNAHVPLQIAGPFELGAPRIETGTP